MLDSQTVSFQVYLAMVTVEFQDLAIDWKQAILKCPGEDIALVLLAFWTRRCHVLILHDKSIIRRIYHFYGVFLNDVQNVFCKTKPLISIK